MGVCAQTIYRWDRDPKMTAQGWPPRIKFNERNYRSRKLLESFKANLAQVGLDTTRRPKSSGARRAAPAQTPKGA
jgi:hypothetical protein